MYLDCSEPSVNEKFDHFNEESAHNYFGKLISPKRILVLATKPKSDKKIGFVLNLQGSSMVKFDRERQMFLFVRNLGPENLTHFEVKLLKFREIIKELQLFGII